LGPDRRVGARAVEQWFGLKPLMMTCSGVRQFVETSATNSLRSLLVIAHGCALVSWGRGPKPRSLYLGGEDAGGDLKCNARREGRLEVPAFAVCSTLAGGEVGSARTHEFPKGPALRDVHGEDEQFRRPYGDEDDALAGVGWQMTRR